MYYNLFINSSQSSPQHEMLDDTLTAREMEMDFTLEPTEQDISRLVVINLLVA